MSIGIFAHLYSPKRIVKVGHAAALSLQCNYIVPFLCHITEHLALVGLQSPISSQSCPALVPIGHGAVNGRA